MPALESETFAAVVVGPNEKYRLVGIDATNGNERWRGETGFAHFPPRNPVVADGRFTISTPRRVVGYAPTEGTKEWQGPRTAPRNSGVPTEFATTADTLVASHSFSYGYRLSDASERWRRPTRTAPAVIGGKYLFDVDAREKDGGPDEYWIVARNVRNGLVVATRPIDGALRSIRVADGRLYVKIGQQEHGNGRGLIALE